MNTKRLFIFFGMISLFSGHSMAMNCPTSLSHGEMKTLRDEGSVKIDDKTYEPEYRAGDTIKKAIKSTVNPLRILEKIPLLMTTVTLHARTPTARN